jgi:alpha-beta hydrolase superfamily lysophospholipase
MTQTPAPPAPPVRRAWIDILVCMIVLAGAYLGRGLFIASRAGGHYPAWAAIVDFVGVALIIFVFRMFDLGAQAIAGRTIGNSTRARRIMAVILRWSFVFIVAAPCLMALAQFHPQRIACDSSPEQLGLPCSEVDFECDGLRLSGWDVPVSAPDRPVVLIAHGLGANKQNFLPVVQMIHELDYHAFIFDFRGHGDSDGWVTTFGDRESRDLKAAHDQVVARHPRSRVFGLGYSMGGSALVKMAAEHHRAFDRIVLDGTFARAENVARGTLLRPFGLLRGPIWQMGRFWGWAISGTDLGHHEPEKWISGLSDRPLLLIHGTADSMIPHTEAVRLHELAGSRSAELWLVEGAGHLGTINHPDYRDRLRHFFEKPLAAARRVAGR